MQTETECYRLLDSLLMSVGVFSFDTTATFCNNAIILAVLILFSFSTEGASDVHRRQTCYCFTACPIPVPCNLKTA